jgi:hypothetical protein
MGIVVAGIVAANLSLVDHDQDRDDTSSIALPSPDLDTGDRAEPASRSTNRAEPQGEGDPAGEPAVSATITDLINGREQPSPMQPPKSGDGEYLVVGGEDEPADLGAGEAVRYLVEVEAGLPFDSDEFAADVHRILNDERGWGASEDAGFRRVDDGPVRFRVSLSSPDLTDEQCYPLLTGGEVSCWNGTRAVINAERWGTGAGTYGADLLAYREYLVSHEVGHALGHGHVNCPSEGELAPVMVQQTKSLGGCEANPWPDP